jgi:aryl-alcohol dehydrogenase-like predicted oxidoreductase
LSKKKCLGLLGFAGNYGAVNPNDLTQPLKFAMDNYDVIDLSHDYGIKYNLLSIVVRLMPARSKARYIYKIGREYKGNYNACELIASSTKGIESLGPERLECIMFHRPAEEKLKSDIEAFEYLSKQYPFLSWGICTNDEEVYLNYKKQTRVDCVQLALNPFDYSSVQPFIRTLIADKVAIQARSILSSGFLSGKYNTNSTFDDPLRLRYNTPEYRTHYLERIHIGNDILKYIDRNVGVSTCSIAPFLYSAFEEISWIDFVIRGGSDLEQIKKNYERMDVPNSFMKDFVYQMLTNWACPYKTL